MPYLFDIVLMIVVVGAALIIGFWWSLLLVANNDRGLVGTGLAAIGLLAAYRWWQNHHSNQDDIEEFKRR